ncbi:signal peptidase I [Halobium salinum]|uniref:Signal peptidase I n=2 Tax=Halobium salinum TaxID=1364940 RepID=A0ABD5PF17_9EURY
MRLSHRQVAGWIISISVLFGVLLAAPVNWMHPSVEVSGCSMYPALEPGEIVILEPTSTSDLSKGDIVAFRAIGTLVIHRVVEKRNRTVGTKGDLARKQFWFEQRITDSQILGRKLFSIPLPWNPDRQCRTSPPL